MGYGRAGGRFSGLLAVAGMVLLAAMPARAQTVSVCTWMNYAGDWAWNTTSTDWAGGGGAWINDTTQSQAVFTMPGTNSFTIGSGIQANAITFNAGATGYTFSGGDITLGSGGITANETATIATPISFAANQTWNVAAGKTLAAGSLSDNAQGFGLTKAGGGLLVLSGACSYGGATAVSGGTLQLQPPWPAVVGPSIASFTSDANSGISSANTYTEALAFAQGGGLTIQGVPFANASNTGGTGQQNTTWTLNVGNSNYLGNFPGGFPLDPASGTYALLNHFYYNGPGPGAVTLTVANLTPGATYDARLYYRSWGNPGDSRLADFTFNSGNSWQTLAVDEDADAGAHYIDYQYTVGQAGVLSIAESSDPAGGGGSWYWYGFTNQYVAPPPTILPGSTTATIAAAATLDLGGVSQALGALADYAPGSAGSLVNSSTTPCILTLSPTGTSTFSGVIQGGGGLGMIGLVLAGSGTQILAGSNTYTGGTTISSGTLQLGDGLARNGSVQGNILNNGRLVFANPWPQTYTGTIGGGGALVMAGPGTLTLTGSNTYTGGTTISNGTLQLGDGSSNGYVQGNILILNNAALTFANGTAQTFSGAISGSGSLTKTGSGLLGLTTAGSYTGATTISGGTLQLQPPPPPANTPSIASFTSDANAGISPANIYTEALAFSQGAGLTIQGVQFANATSAGGTGLYNTTWTLSLGGFSNSLGSFPAGFPLAQGSGTWNLLNHFYYSAAGQGAVALTLANLTPGAMYDARLYYRAFNAPGDSRLADFTFNSGGSQQTLTVDEDADTGAHYIDFPYVAGSSGVLSISESSNPLGTGGSWYWYGFTNQYVGLPSSPGVNLLPTTTALSLAAGATLDLGGFNQQLASLADYAPGSSERHALHPHA